MLRSSALKSIKLHWEKLKKALKQGLLHSHELEGSVIVITLILFKLNYRIDAVPINIPAAIFLEIDKLILKMV